MDDLIGRRFGKLRVVKRGQSQYTSKNSCRSMWLCKCECGNSILTRRDALTGGNTISCGCVRGRIRSRRSRDKLNGLRSSREYRIWTHILQRCFNPKSHKYHMYGKKGIKVHQPWVESFLSFYHYMGPCPSNLHSIDRYPNRHGNYEPGNVRWATAQEQVDNRDATKIITFMGLSLTITEWSKKLGIKAGTIRGRLSHGLPPLVLCNLKTKKKLNRKIGG